MPYRIAAVANYPESGPGTLNHNDIRGAGELSGKTALLSDNAPGQLMMYGEETFIPHSSGPGEPAAEKTVSVTRLVSRIEVRKISVDFSSRADLAGKTLLLRGIFITNAYRTSCYGHDYSYADLSSDRNAWYNTMGWHRGETAISELDMLLGDSELDIPIADGGSYTEEHVFYAFPNPIPPGLDSREIFPWSSRRTRLVIAGEIEGTIGYYTVTLPPMARNVIYSAGDILITGRGASDPEAIDSTAAPVITYTLEVTKSGGTPAVGLKIAVGGSHQLKAVLRTFADGILSDTRDVTASALWSAASSPEGNAAVSLSGLVSGLRPGPAVISAAYSPEGGPTLSASVPISVITWSDDWEDDPEIEL